MLAADAALVGLTAGCLAVGGDNACTLPILGYFATGPIVHTSNRSGERGFASLAMRVALPFVGLAIGGAFVDCPPREPNSLDLCGVDKLAIGALSGMVVAMAIDSIWAFKDVAPAPSRTPLRRASWAVTPTLKVSDNSAGVGLAGRF